MKINHRRQQGLSLVEMMVSLTIGMFLITGVSQVFLSGKQTYRVVEATSESQEVGRFALDLIARDVRMAGYQGCPGIASVEPAIEGKLDPAAGDVDLPIVDAESILSGTAGSITILRANSSCSANLTVDSTTSTVTVASANSCGFRDRDILLVTDCSKADLFAVNGTPVNGVITTLDSLYHTYDASAQVMAFSSKTYFVDGTTTPPSFWRSVISQVDGGTPPSPTIVSERILDGVQGMQILFGEQDGLSQNLSYITAANVADWSRVTGVRLTLSTQAIDTLDIASKDFTTTVNLRNRGL